LILDDALRRGHRPLLAGRGSAQLRALGDAAGLDTVPLALEDGAALRAALSGVKCVLLAAGSYELTGPLMRAACVDTGCSYLDINGELEDFSRALACDAAARAAGIAVIPGAGYGVMFGECLAAMISDGPDISEGIVRRRPIASPTWRMRHVDGQRIRFAAVPRAELVAVERSTGVPNIVAGIAMSRATAGFIRLTGPWLGTLLAGYGARSSTTPGPAAPDAAIAAIRSRVWVEAGDAAGTRAAAVLETGEGYRAAAAAAVRAVELQLHETRVGALTPVQAFGAEFALLVPGTRIQKLERP
jgi:short subunit dehydrogenase-like uncharacterized protein